MPRLEIEPIADSLLHSTSAGKLRVLREADQRDAEVVRVGLAVGRERRAAHQDERSEQDRESPHTSLTTGGAISSPAGKMAIDFAEDPAATCSKETRATT
jgi:hypothetical protein